MSLGMLILLVYLAGCMISWVPMTRWMISPEGGDLGDDLAEIFVAISMVISCLCWFWPLLIPGWWIYQMVRSDK